MSDAVGLVPVEVGYEPCSVHLLHSEFVLLNVRHRVKRAVLPFLSHVDSGHSVGFVGQLDANHLEVGYRAAVARHEVVEPFVVERFEFRQEVKHSVQHSVEVLGHIVARLLEQLVVGDILTQFRSPLLELLFLIIVASHHKQGRRNDKSKFFHCCLFINSCSKSP